MNYVYHNPAKNIRQARLTSEAAALAASSQGLNARASRAIGHYAVAMLRSGCSSAMAISHAAKLAQAIGESQC